MGGVIGEIKLNENVYINRDISSNLKLILWWKIFVRPDNSDINFQPKFVNQYYTLEITICEEIFAFEST
jgi:hypothetical protein